MNTFPVSTGAEERFHPSHHAAYQPEKLAYWVHPSGESATYRELNERSNRIAHLLRANDCRRGDVVAILMENNGHYFELTWAASRAGLYFVGLSTRLAAVELAFIVRDCGAKLLFASAAQATLALAVAKQSAGGVRLLMRDSAMAPFEAYDTELKRFPVTPINDESSGAPMLYSSGTTGRPKGIKSYLPDEPIDALDPLTAIGRLHFGLSADTIFLSPAPLYHAAPLRWSLSVQKLGGTVVVMEKYDSADALNIIQERRVTHAQWVPTHFVRMLKLPDSVRRQYDLSSLQLVFHASAPCPVAIKDTMIDWWGPIISEYYAGTEFNGMTLISASEWLTHKGSVGTAKSGTLHIVGDDGKVLSAGEEGLVYFEGGNRFEYHNDPIKTAEAFNSAGWSTLGDVGKMDADGYLSLTDRKGFLIISGGVNIYPQEVENALVTHPKVADAAVIGAPDEDLGERMVAVVQPTDWNDAGDDLAVELKTWLRARLGPIKVPRQIDFTTELPRHPNGKLLKRLLRDEYWKKTS